MYVAVCSQTVLWYGAVRNAQHRSMDKETLCVCLNHVCILCVHRHVILCILCHPLPPHMYACIDNAQDMTDI